MTFLEVGERLWRVAPLSASRTRQRTKMRHSRIYLILAFLVVDVAIFWFGLSLSGFTIDGAPASTPRPSPSSNGTVLSAANASASGSRQLRPVSLPDGALPPSPSSGATRAAGQPQSAQSATAAAPGSSGGPAGSTSGPTTGRPTTPPLSPPPAGPPATTPGLPSVLQPVTQTVTATVNDLVNLLAPVVQGGDTTLNNVLKPVLSLPPVTLPPVTLPPVTLPPLLGHH